MTALLQIDGLSFAYGTQDIFSDLSLSLTPSRVSAVVGGSGAGKTTLLKCILMLLRPKFGRLSYFVDPRFEIDFSRADSRVHTEEEWEREIGVDLTRLRTRIGYVPQGSVLIPFKSLRANVAMPLILTQRLSLKESDDIALEALKRMAIEELANAQPWQVSGGQMQRAAIARAMAMRPAVYLLDEPTGALDAANVELVGQQIQDDVRSRGAAALIVTHNLGFAQKYCDELYVLKGGGLSPPAPVGDVDWATLLADLI